MTELLPCAVVEPEGDARCCVLWLHGLGADGHDFEPIVPELGLAPELGVRFVFPHAPAIPVTINGGFVMPAWYDILSPELERRHDEAGVGRSAAAVEALLLREIESGIAPADIVLAGFSQGGAVASHVALRFGRRLAGLLLLSTYLVCEESLERERSEANAALPIFQAHGLLDPMVTLERGTTARDRLTALGHAVEWHTYPIEHQVSLDEIRDVGAWLGAHLGG